MSTGSGSRTPASTAATEVIVCDDGAVWDAYVTGHPERGLYQLWAWREIISTSYSREPIYLAARRESRVVGVLPLFRISSPLFGASLHSLPYHWIGGPLADDAGALEALLENARRTAREMDGQLVIRASAPLPGEFAIDERKSTFTLDLTPGPEAVFKTIRKQNRTRVRKAGREGVSVSLGHEHLDAYYGVYCRTMRELGAPVCGRDVFEGVLAAFGENANCAIAWKDGRPIASKLFIDVFGARHFIWGANDRRHAKLSPNYILMWTCLEDAMSKGLPVADLGRSNRDSSHALSKRQWGTVESSLYYHTWRPDMSQVKIVDATSPKMALAGSIWRRLPLPLTRWIGPAAGRLIP